MSPADDVRADLRRSVREALAALTAQTHALGLVVLALEEGDHEAARAALGEVAREQRTIADEMARRWL